MLSVVSFVMIGNADETTTTSNNTGGAIAQAGYVADWKIQNLNA
jgi:hypothetical protein